MKKEIIVLLLVLLTFLVKGQSIFDDFENAACNNQTCTGCAFNYINGGSCLSGWNSSHGTPNTFGPQYSGAIRADFADLRTRLTGQCLNVFWSESNKSEGALRSFSFRKDICYKISMKVAVSLGDDNTNPNNVRLLKIFAGSTIPVKGCCITEEPLPNIPSSKTEAIGVKTFVASSFAVDKFSQWETIVFYYRTTRTDMNQIWLYPEVAGGKLVVAIDDFSVEEKCSASINLDKTNIFYSGNWASSDFISVGSNLGIVQFFQYENTVLKAGTRITLGNGTRIGTPASSSTSFIARIEPCTLESSACNSPYGPGIAPPPILNVEAFSARKTVGANDFTISPNPSNGIFNILGADSFSDSEKEIEIFNILGTKVLSGKFAGNEYQIDMSNKPTGNYLVRIKIANKLLTYKIVKQ
jgi:Secretion system C-terminal sorting domain